MVKKSDISPHYKLGKDGEAYAQEFVKANGYKVLHTNWFYARKEIDIVALKNDVLTIFEVKTRFENNWEDPKDAVKMRKQRNIIDAADAYVQQYDLNFDVQFDVISIIYNGKTFKLEHIPDAFTPTL